MIEHPEEQPAPTTQMIVVRCPKCSQEHRLAQDKIGGMARCPCGQSFQIASGDSGDFNTAITPVPVNGPVVPLPAHSTNGDLFDHQLGNGGQSSPPISLAAMLRQKWWILGTFFVVAAVTVPCIWVFTTPLYRATALLRVAPFISRIVFRHEEQSIPFYDGYVNTQVSTIRSPTILQRVLDQDKIRKTNWYLEKPTSLLGTPLSHMERFRDELSVRPRRRTELIEVSMTCRFASDAKIIADAVVSEYKKYIDETMRETDIQRFETLTSELESLRRELEAATAIKSTLSKPLGTSDPEQHRLQLRTRLNALELEQQTLLRKHTITQQELGTATSVKNEGREQGGSDVAETNLGGAEQPYFFDPEWRQLDNALGTTRHQLELERQKYGESHPHIKDLVSTVEHAEESLDKREKQLDEQWEKRPGQVPFSPTIQPNALDRAALLRVAQNQQRELELLNKEIELQRAMAAEVAEIAQNIAKYDEEIQHKRRLYAAVWSRLQELELEGKAPARISVAAYALAPSRPHRDRRVLLSMMALAAAMGIGLAVGYMRSSLNPKIFEAKDVRQTIHVPFLGQLPSLAATEDPRLHADPILLEGIRMVRTSLLGRLSSDQRVVLLTSCSGQAGKSTVAALLAQSLAEMGKKVLLIEGDLRRPVLARRILGHESKIGLAAVLAGATTDTKAVRSTETPNFDVLVAGEQPEDFTFELLANGRLAECLSGWKKKYDLLLLDSPPVCSCADTRILAEHTDGTIMVLRASHCRRAEVIQAYVDLCASGATLLGTVLVDVRDGLSYSDNYSYETNHHDPREREAAGQIPTSQDDHPGPD